MEEKIDKKAIKAFAKEKLSTGKPKQEVYDELVSEYKSRNEIAKIVGNLPTAARLKKYGVLNTIYLSFLILVTACSLIQPSIGIVWFAWLIYFAVTKNYKLYYWNTVLGVISLVAVMADAVLAHTLPWIVTIITALLAVIFIVAGIYLPKVLTPSFTEITEPKPGGDRDEKIIVNHIFVE